MVLYGANDVFRSWNLLWMADNVQVNMVCTSLDSLGLVCAIVDSGDFIWSANPNIVCKRSGWLHLNCTLTLR